MVAAACLPVLRAEWGMTATEAGTVAAGFSFGYAASLLVFSWLADRIGAKRVFLISAALSVMSALTFGFFARSYTSGLIFYTLSALTQGGLYTPAIMLFADRYAPERRGTAVGWLIASNTLGYGFSVLMAGAMLASAAINRRSSSLGCYLCLASLFAGWRSAAPTMSSDPARRGRDLADHAVQCHGTASGRRVHLPLLGTADDVGLAARFPSRRIGSRRYRTGQGDPDRRLSDSDHLPDRILRILVNGDLVRSPWTAHRPSVHRHPEQRFFDGLRLAGGLADDGAAGSRPRLHLCRGRRFSRPVGRPTEAVDPASLGSVLALRALLGFSTGAVGPIVFGVIIDSTNAPGTTPDTWGWAFVAVGLGGLGAAWSAFRLNR